MPQFSHGRILFERQKIYIKEYICKKLYMRAEERDQTVLSKCMGALTLQRQTIENIAVPAIYLILFVVCGQENPDECYYNKTHPSLRFEREVSILFTGLYICYNKITSHLADNILKFNDFHSPMKHQLNFSRRLTSVDLPKCLMEMSPFKPVGCTLLLKNDGRLSYKRTRKDSYMWNIYRIEKTYGKYRQSCTVIQLRYRSYIPCHS